MDQMRPQFSTYIILIMAIHFFGLYYCFIFCSIYVKSVNGWIEGVAFNFLIDFCVSGFLIPFLIAIFRKIIQLFRRKE